MTKPSVSLALLWGAFIALTMAPALGQPPTPPAILFTGGCGFEVANKLAQAGFALNSLSWPGLAETPLTAEKTKQYNVIVIEGLGQSNADMTLTKINAANLEALRSYLNEGGGILFIPVFGQMITAKPPQDAFLKPLGLTPLFDEMLFDPEGTVATAWKINFGHTTDIAESPITADVKSLWYPACGRIGAQNHLLPFAADNSWTVLVRGSKASYTKKGPLQVASPTEPGTYQNSVPFVAYKQVGKGRIVYLGITPEYLLGRHAMTTLEGIVLERGLRQIPSDGYKLLENALKWLAEPSLAAGNLGGAKMDPALLENPNKTKFGKPYDWPVEITFPPVEPAWPGVIGARSAYSSGQGTVEEWVRAAKAQGLAFLVFLEEFASLTPEEFDQLKADCARLSDQDFAAIPGFTIDDEIGNHYFYFGTAFPYPDKKFLDPSGKFFVSRDGEFPDNMYQKGQLAMTVLDYAYSISSFRLTAGNYLFNRSPVPCFPWFSNWDAFGVITEQDGQVLEDATAAYLKEVDFGDGPVPLAINLVDAPAELAQVKWKTVLRMPEQGGYTVAGPLRPESKIADYFDHWNFYPDNPNKIYVTSGPEIESWCFVGPRDYGGDNPDDFVWQNYRWVLRGRATSQVGLREVAVYDGETPFRRYLPGGPQEFEFTLDLTHDVQHNLVIIATDTQGNRAIGHEQWDRNHRSEEFMCSDRNNQLSYGYSTRQDGTGLLIGGNQTLATPNKRLSPEISPSGTFKNDAILGAPAFDGAAGGEPVFIEHTRALSTAGGEIVAPNVTESRRVMHNGDVNIGEGLRAHYFADGINVYNVWHTLWRTEPAQDFTVKRRNHFIQIDPDSPLAVFLWQIDVKLLRDLPNRGFAIGFLRTSEDKVWAVRTSEGAVYAGVWDDTERSQGRWLTLPFGPGAYTALLDSPLGGAAVFSLTEGLQLSLGLPRRTNPSIFLSAEASPQQRDQSARVELLILGIPRATDYTRMLPPGSTEVVERFYRDFGLDGGPTGYTVTEQSGKVTGRRYFLDLDGSADRCFSGKLEGKLISTLPIRVAGLNDRWSCYLYDRGRKKARPLGVLEGRGWATVRVQGALDLFVGQPLVADNPEVFIQVTQVGENDWRAEIHNPTDQALRVTVKKNPFFDPLREKPFTQETLDLPAGGSVWRNW